MEYGLVDQRKIACFATTLSSIEKVDKAELETGLLIGFEFMEARKLDADEICVRLKVRFGLNFTPFIRFKRARGRGFKV